MEKYCLYIGILYDRKGRELGIKDKKIGKTKTPEIREKTLNKTKSPIGYMYIKLYEFESEEISYNVEQMLHKIFIDRETEGEWFEDEDENLVERVEVFLSGLSKLGIKWNEIDLELTQNLNKEEKTQIQRIKKSKISLLYNGVNLTEDGFCWETYIKGIDVIANIVGWDKVVSYGKKVFDNIQRLEEYYKGQASVEKRFKEHNGYYIWTHCPNSEKCRYINELINYFKVKGLECVTI
jgi:hypothetical protein